MQGYTKVIGYRAPRILEEPNDTGLTLPASFTGLFLSPGSDWAHRAPRSGGCQWREGELWMVFLPLSTASRMSPPYLLPDTAKPHSLAITFHPGVKGGVLLAHDLCGL